MNASYARIPFPGDAVEANEVSKRDRSCRINIVCLKISDINSNSVASGIDQLNISAIVSNSYHQHAVPARTSSLLSLLSLFSPATWA